MTLQVHGLIGCPGSGKTTIANTYDPKEWVVCTFDDLRQAMWPPSRKTYWKLRKTDKGVDAQHVLHATQRAIITSALENNFNVLSANTNIAEKDATTIMEIAAIFGIQVKWKLLEVPLHILQQRNSERCILTERISDDLLVDRYEKLWDNKAWWRDQDVEIIKYHPTPIEENESVEHALKKLIHDFPKVARKAVDFAHHRDFFIEELKSNLKSNDKNIEEVVYMHFGWPIP